MPGTNLTREEAATRAALLDVTSYDIDLDLTTGDRAFASTTTIAFTATEGASTFADLLDATIHEITLNGIPLDPAAAYAEGRITLTGLAAENVLVVRAECTYSHSGEGLHRFVDPADGRVYTYSQFEAADARRVYTCFEQPDLKSVYTVHVVAPEHWQVVSNAPVAAITPLGNDGPGDGTGGTARWDFETTKKMSTYITALIAGEYHAVRDVYEGRYGEIPLGHYCRQSLAPYLDREELVKITKQGFAFFEDVFDYPYPFGKYDQLYVPEYNMGAMENAGAVTLRDEYLPRSQQLRSFYEFRTSVILHEMAHMWFGDLVTMKWWNDLWLNESFAEWACYHAEAEATEFTDSWTGFSNARKLTGYRQDQMVTTHPIAPEINDLHDIEVNFDMITYAKGASVLKQLVAWVGLEPFLRGLRAYFKEFEFANSEFDDLLRHLEAASGRELQGWAQEWLQTSGVNTFTPEFSLDADGTYASLAIRQTAHPDHPTLRRHRIGIGLYDMADGRLVRRTSFEVDVEGELTELKEAIGERQPDLLLVNDQDLTYVKIRLDERSLATALSSLSTCEDSLTRALIWGAAWDMTRDGEMSATDYIDLVLANIGQETDAWGLDRIPAFAEITINAYAAPEKRLALRAHWERGLRRLIDAAAPGSDAQLNFVRRYSGAGDLPLRGAANGAPYGAETIADLRALLSSELVIDGLTVDQDLRWVLVTGLAAAGAYGEAEIATELAADHTISGQEKAAAARAAQPTAEAKQAAFDAAVIDPSVPNETQKAIACSWVRTGQEDVVAPYLTRYLEAAETIWDRLGAHKASSVLEYGFPRTLVTPEALRTIEQWLESSPAPKAAKRFVREGRDEIVRALQAQARDA